MDKIFKFRGNGFRQNRRQYKCLKCLSKSKQWDVFTKENNSSFTVLNSLGALVLEGNGQRIDLSGIENGLYFLKSEGKSQKIVKQ